MEVDESSSETPYSSHRYPHFIRNGQTIRGLDIDSTELPPLESLLGRYSWFLTGFGGPFEPQPDEGMTLQLTDSADGEREVQGELTIIGIPGVITAVRRCNPKEGDIHPSWQCDVTWDLSDGLFYPIETHIYVGIVLDDNNAPFLKVEIRYKQYVFRPYGFAKRQTDEGDATLSEDEQKRLNLLTYAEYSALPDVKEAKERREAMNRKEERERAERERLRRERDSEIQRKGDSEIQRKRDEQRQAQLAAKKANGIVTRKERKKLEQEKRAAENRPRLKTAPRTKKQRKAERERLAREEAKHDLLKNPPHIASTSSIGRQAPTPTPGPQTPTLPLQQWTEFKQEPADLKGFPNSIVKQEEVPPSLHREDPDHHGIKRSHLDDPEDKAFKRLKLEY